MELGETVEDTARREVWEETGLRLGNMTLFAVYSAKEHEVTFPNGHQVANVLMTFLCREYTGDLQQTTEESTDVRFFPQTHLPRNILPGPYSNTAGRSVREAYAHHFRCEFRHSARRTK